MVRSKITKISPQKNSERLNVYLDGSFAFGIKSELLSDYNLRLGEELDQKTIADIKGDDIYKRCLDKAYRYLSYRPRSEKEVTCKLLEKYEPETVERALTRLKELNYINDEEFVQYWLEARGKQLGPIRLKAELAQKGVAKNIIDHSLGILDKAQMVSDATRLIRSKRKYQSLDREGLYKKAAPFLARRGYDYSTIKEAIRNTIPD